MSTCNDENVKRADFVDYLVTEISVKRNGIYELRKLDVRSGTYPLEFYKLVYVFQDKSGSPELYKAAEAAWAAISKAIAKIAAPHSDDEDDSFGSVMANAGVFEGRFKALVQGNENSVFNDMDAISSVLFNAKMSLNYHELAEFMLAKICGDRKDE